MRFGFPLFALVACSLTQAFGQANDNFTGRLALGGATATAVSNNLQATREVGEPNHAAMAAGRSLWWTWTAPATGMANFSAFNGSNANAPARVLAVYSGITLPALTEIASSNNLPYSVGAASDTQAAALAATGASVNVPVTAGAVYQIAVDAASASTARDDGTVVLAINAAPTVVSAATVNAATGASFQYNILASNGATVYGATMLPAGLSVNPASGAINGTPAATGIYPVGLSATGPGGTGTATLTIQVAGPVAVSPTAPVIIAAAGARAVVGKAFTYSISATGVPTAYTASSLPAGLSVNTATGAITGTPTAAGTFAVPLTAANAAGTTSAVLTLNVDAVPPAPVITSALAGTATVGSSYSYSIYTVGDGTLAAPTGYAASGLPPGLSFGTSNYFSGTPTQTGVYPVTLSATNAGGTVTAIVMITVNATVASTSAAAPPQLTSNAVAVAAASATFVYALTATNTPTAYTAANLPAGLSVNAATGVISGTPTTAGSFQVPVSAANTYGAGTGLLTITVAANAAAQAALTGVVQPTITSAAAVGGYAGQALSYALTATYAGSGNLSPAGSWTFTASGLPPGLSLSINSSYFGSTAITGTPTATGTYPVTVTAAVPASISFPPRAAAVTSAVVTFVIQTGSAGVPTFAIAASFSDTVLDSFTNFPTGATNSPTSYAASGLPPGLGINTSAGTLSGSFTAAGTYVATLSATNGAGTGNATVTYNLAPRPPPRLTSLAAAYGTVGSAFSYSLTSNFYFVSCTASNLPPGLSVNPSTCVISGTPTTAGVYQVPVTGMSGNGNGGVSYGTGTGTLTITIAPAAPAIPVVYSYVEAAGTVGSDFSYAVASTPAAASYAVGSLPPGLSFNASSAVIAGTPTAAGTYTVPLSATNVSGTGRATLTLIIAPLPPPMLSGSAVVNTTVGTVFSYGITASNFPTSYAASNLPPGVMLNTATGVISGQVSAAGNYSVPISASNVDGTGTANLTINVVPAGVTNLPAFSTTTPLTYTFPTGGSGAFYISVSGSPTSYTTSGLPAGCSVDAYGTFSYGQQQPIAGVYPGTVTATNAAGSASVVITFIVTGYNTAPPIFSGMRASAVCFSGLDVNTFPSSLGIGANGDPSSYAASGLPPGLSIVASSGVLEGTPTAPGVYPVTLSATNAIGTVNAVWTLIVKDPSVLQPQFSGPTASVAGTVGSSLYVGTFSANTTDTGGIYYPLLTCSFTGLPPGIVGQLSGADIYLYGTPTRAGTYPVTVSVTTFAGVAASEVVTIEVAPAAPPVVTSAASVPGNTGSPITYNLTSYSTITNYAASGLPPGLTINASTGAITGTPVTVGTYPAAITLSSATGSGSAVVTFVIAEPAFGGLPIITSPATALCQDIYSAYSVYYGRPTPALNYVITAINGPTSFGAANLPPGLSLNPYTGVISGQPAVSGTFQVLISATSAAGTCNATLTIITTVTFPTLVAPLAASGSVGTSFTSLIQAPSLRYYGLSFYEQYLKPYDPVTFGAAGLPPGLSMDTATGYITGTPSQAGTYPVVLTTANRAGTSSGTMTIVITATAPAPTAPPVFTGLATASGFVGFPLNYVLAATNGPSYTPASLPAGLNLNAATGQITGTPQVAGTFAVPVTATNNLGIVQGVLTVVVAAAPTAPFISSAAQTNATVGTPFVYAVYAGNYSGMPAAASYGAGDLPAGLRFDPKTGVISGTPTGPAGIYQVPLSAVTGGITGSATLTLAVQAATASPGPPALTAPAGMLGFVGNPFICNVPTAFHPTGALPSGLGFNAATGEISGLPVNAGTYTIALTTDPAGGNNASADGSAILTLTIVAPDLSLPFITTQPGGGTILQNEIFTFTAAAIGAPAPSYQWARDGVPIPGTIASALTLTQAQPADAGTYTVTVANTAGQTVSAPVVLVIHQTYATWQAAHFTGAEITAGQGALEVDFDGDGVANLLKYALGIDPITSAGGSLPVSSYSTADHALQLSFTRDTAKIDIGYVVEASSDLSQWTPIASSTMGASTINLGGSLAIVETASYGTSRVEVVVESSRSAVTPERQFLRLRVVQP